jgi:hypothetical protein
MYDVPESGVSRHNAIKRKLSEIEESKKDLDELLFHLSKRPLSEAQGIFDRLRSHESPTAVLRIIKEGDLLLSKRLQDSHPQPTMQALETEGLKKSKIKVPARPWTTIAGDGIVSELVSSFFAWDNIFFIMFIDKQAFLEDMRKQDVTGARYCSPFLVNVICSLRCVSREAVRSVLPCFANVA